MIQEKYRDAVQPCRDGARKAKAHLNLNLVKHVEGKEKGFYRYISRKTKTRKNVCPLLNWAGKLVTKDMENAFLTSVFTDKICPQEHQAPENCGKVQNNEELPVAKEQLREHLNKLDIHKSLALLSTEAMG